MTSWITDISQIIVFGYLVDISMIKFAPNIVYFSALPILVNYSYNIL